MSFTNPPNDPLFANAWHLRNVGGAAQGNGTAGNDTLYSLGGADIFSYTAAGWGLDQIGGFAAGAKLQF